MSAYTMAELDFGAALILYFQQTAKNLHEAYPALCERDELHRLLDAALDEVQP